jgi:hypothetical protein
VRTLFDLADVSSGPADRFVRGRRDHDLDLLERRYGKVKDLEFKIKFGEDLGSHDEKTSCGRTRKFSESDQVLDALIVIQNYRKV